MARPRAAESPRAKSKSALIDEITRGIAKFSDILATIDDCTKEGFPYRDGARAKAELQLRETIRRIFGERSPEFQAHRNHKLHISNPAETKHSIELIKSLIESLEQRKLELQGAAPPPAQEPAAAPAQAKPQMTLVPPAPAPLAPVTNSEPAAAETAPPIPSAATPIQTYSAPASAPAPAQIDPSPLWKDPPPLPTPMPAAPDSIPASHPSTSPVHAVSQATQPLAPLPETQPTPAATPAPVPAATHPPEPVAACPPIWETVPPKKASPDTPPVNPEPPAHPASPQKTPANPAWASETGPIVRPLDQTEPPPAPPSLAERTPAPAPTTAPHNAINLPADPDPLDALRKVCMRFHAVARQLRLRKDYRQTLEVEDDYDLQDLLCALLRLEFDEVGSDEWTPPYTAGTPRTVFLIDKDRTAIVAKKTRSGLTPKELAEQVAADTERYAARTHCTALFCFIYDPEGRIGSPKRLETDLTSVSDAFTVEVLVAPK